MEKELKAWAIGPDRFEIVVGYDEESAIAYYEKETGVNRDEWENIRPFPMDTKLLFENEDGPGYVERTLREMCADITKFPVIAGYSE